MRIRALLPSIVAVSVGVLAFILFGGLEDQDTSGSYACPMLCVVLDSPGLCPVCGMELEQIQQTGDTLLVSEHGAGLMGLQTASAQSVQLSYRVSVPARVIPVREADVTVSALAPGRITDVVTAGSGQIVRAGDLLASAYSPDLLRAEIDYLAALDTGLEGLIQPARSNIEELGGSIPAQGNQPDGYYAIRATVDGQITEFYLDSGTWFSRGQPIASILDSSGSELMINAPLDLMDQLNPGVSVTVQNATDSFTTTLSRVEPLVHQQTQTVIGYAPLPETSALSPGVQLTCLLDIPLPWNSVAVPERAVLTLGRRSIVYVAIDRTSYQPRLVEVGTPGVDEAGEVWVPVNSGLQVGETVVLDGAFLLDSQAELTGVMSLMNESD